MMIRKVVILCLMVMCTRIVVAQDVKLLTVDQLENRYKNGQDTVYIVNFWATWCGPCVEELPAFEKLRAAHQNSPLKILLVSVDFKSKLETAVKPFVKKRKFKNEVFLLNEKSQQTYIDRISKEWSGALPATLIVNQKRNIRKLFEQEFTYAELEKTYQELK